MIRLVAAAFVALACAMPFAAQAQAPRLPAGVDPQNALEAYFLSLTQPREHVEPGQDRAI